MTLVFTLRDALELFDMCSGILAVWFLLKMTCSTTVFSIQDSDYKAKAATLSNLQHLTSHRTIPKEKMSTFSSYRLPEMISSKE